MSIRFEDTSYFKALQLNEDLSTEENVFFSVKENLQYSYGNVTHETFKTKYSNEGRIGRKFTAIPAALWSGLVKSVYHLAKAIFIGCPKAFSDKGQYRKAQFYNVRRDFQEAWGRLSGIFDDAYGQFHVLESQFQKTCYDCVLDPNTFWASSDSYEPDSQSSSYKHGITVNAEAKKTTLFQYKKRPAQLRERLLKRFKIDEASLKLIEKADQHVLEALTLEDLIIPFENSKLKYAVFSNEDFDALKPVDIYGINEEQASFIKQRIHLRSVQRNEENLSKIDLNEGSPILLKNLNRYKTSDILGYTHCFPSICFAFFTNDQIKFIKLSKMTAAQNQALFFGLNDKQRDERLQLFEDQDIIDAMREGLLSNDLLISLSDSINAKLDKSEGNIEQLKISEFTKEQADIVFSWKEDSTQDAKRFKAYAVSDVQKAINEGILSTPYQLHLLSDDHLKGLKLSELTKTDISNMFTWCENDAVDKKRFAHLQAKEIQIALENNKLTEYQIQLIHIEQIKEFDFSKLSQQMINHFFPLYSVEHLRKKNMYINTTTVTKDNFSQTISGARCIYSPEVLLKMSDEQKRKNDKLFSQLTKKQQEDLKARLYKEEPSTKNHSNTSYSGFEEFFEAFFEHGFDENFFDQNFNGLFHDNNVNKDAFYQALGLQPNASEEDIKKAFRKLTLKCHPDKQVKQSDESEADFVARRKESEEEFKKIANAYEKLTQK